MSQRVLFATLAFLAALFFLALHMSSGNYPKDDYYTVIEYQEQASTTDSTLTIMTYNIGYLSGMTNNQSVKREKQLFDKHLNRAKQLFSVIEPDIVGFQEIDFGARRSFHVNQLDTLARAGNYANAYRSVNWDKNYVPFPYWPPSSHFGRVLSGQAILSGLPILNGETAVLPPDESTPFYYQAFYIDRLLQIAKIDWLGQELIVMNVHLEAWSRETRLEQIAVVKDAYERYAEEYPVILMGDFNSLVPALTGEPDAIDRLMEAPFIASAIPLDQHSKNNTYSSVDPVRMIDYIFYNQNFLQCDSARVVSEAGDLSDHLPVWGRLELSM